MKGIILVLHTTIRILFTLFLLAFIKFSFAINVTNIHPSHLQRKHLIEHPYLISAQVYTVNPRVTFDKPRLGDLIWFNYNVLPEIYVRLTYLNFLKNNSVAYLTGFARATGKFRPYIEFQYQENFFQGGAGSNGIFLYDVGLIYVTGKFITPALQFDNYVDKRIDIRPQLIFSFTRRFSALVAYIYLFNTKDNSLLFRLNYNF